jgi:alkylation response protein AidB-like acyl-CoA dehydrogenase
MPTSPPRGTDHEQAMSTHLGEALGTDSFSVREQFTDEQWTHFITVRKLGAKRWIGLGSVADLVVVWAHNTEDGQVNAFVVKKGSSGILGAGNRRKGAAALGVAGRHHAGQRAGPGREPAARGALVPGHQSGADHHAPSHRRG